jgi:cardiolipin synthase
LILLDHAVHVGSANLDARSLRINYELMLRFTNRELMAGARGLFKDYLAHSRRIEYAEWCRSRTWWRRFKYRWAYFLLARVDPYVARWQHRNVPD